MAVAPKRFSCSICSPAMRSAFSAESRPVSTRMAPIELLLPIGWALPYACDSPVLFAWFRLMLGKLVLTGFIVRFLSMFQGVSAPSAGVDALRRGSLLENLRVGGSDEAYGIVSS